MFCLTGALQVASVGICDSTSSWRRNRFPRLRFNLLFVEIVRVTKLNTYLLTYLLTYIGCVTNCVLLLLLSLLLLLLMPYTRGRRSLICLRTALFVPDPLCQLFCRPFSVLSTHSRAPDYLIDLDMTRDMTRDLDRRRTVSSCCH